MPIDYTQLKTHLWSAADKLQANSRLRSHEYSVPVLGLIFLRYADVKFSQVESKLKVQEAPASGRRLSAHLDPNRYKAEGVVYLPAETRFNYLVGLPEAVKIYKAILLDKEVGDYQARVTILATLAAKIRSHDPTVDLDQILSDIETILDESIASRTYIINPTNRLIDLSQIDFEALAEGFKQGQKQTEVEKLRGAINLKLNQLVRLNRQRMDYQAEFQKMIDAYNNGSRNVEQMFEDLVTFVKALTVEEQRHMAEELTEEELALFDLLTRPDLNLTKKEQEAVKKAARNLLAKLKDGKLTLDWRKYQQTQATVKITIEDILDAQLPAAYTPDLFQEKCKLIYQHIYEHYYGDGRSTYTALPLGV